MLFAICLYTTDIMIHIMKWIVPLSILILFEIVADIYAKEWSLMGGTTRWLTAFGAYALANTFWLFALKNGSGLGRGAILFSVVSAILAAGIGIFLYKEALSKYQLIGIAIGLISLVLLFWEE